MSLHALIDYDKNDLATIHANKSMPEAVKQLTSNGLNALAVVNAAHQLVGILTDHDIMRALASRGSAFDRETIASWMTKRVITCPENTKLSKALALMGKHQIRHLVVEKNNEPIAVLGIRRILRKMHEDDELEVKVLRDVARLKGVIAA